MKRWEIHHPSLLSAMSFAATMVWGPKFYAVAKASDWKVDQAYTCVFTIMTVFTAFLFTFYTFVVSAERGFLGRARDSTYFRQTVTYTLRAIVIGSILAAATIPLLVVQPIPKQGDLWLVYASAWVGLTTWAVAAFVRAAYLFSIFAHHQH